MRHNACHRRDLKSHFRHFALPKNDRSALNVAHVFNIAHHSPSSVEKGSSSHPSYPCSASTPVCIYRLSRPHPTQAIMQLPKIFGPMSRMSGEPNEPPGLCNPIQHRITCYTPVVVQYHHLVSFDAAIFWLPPSTPLFSIIGNIFGGKMDNWTVGLF